jgi:nucleoside 2-deoxyribosyltransferase
MSNSADGHVAERFYIATRKDRSAQADALSEVLRAEGWQRTFAWTGQDAAKPDEHAATAAAELEAVRVADVLVVLLPGGNGTHVEIGAALALGKPIVLHIGPLFIRAIPHPNVQ